MLFFEMKMKRLDTASGSEKTLVVLWELVWVPSLGEGKETFPTSRHVNVGVRAYSRVMAGSLDFLCHLLEWWPVLLTSSAIFWVKCDFIWENCPLARNTETEIATLSKRSIGTTKILYLLFAALFFFQDGW